MQREVVAFVGCCTPVVNKLLCMKNAGTQQEFESAGAVYSTEESSGPQNLKISIVLKASKSAGAKGYVSKSYKFVHPLHPC